MFTYGLPEASQKGAPSVARALLAAGKVGQFGAPSSANRTLISSAECLRGGRGEG